MPLEVQLKLSKIVVLKRFVSMGGWNNQDAVAKGFGDVTYMPGQEIGIEERRKWHHKHLPYLIASGHVQEEKLICCPMCHQSLPT